MVKIVTTARSQEDVQRVMSLYEWFRREVKDLPEGSLIAFCMGEEGRQSRLDCLKHGAPYTYAALSEEESAAPGQWPAAELGKAVYGDFGFIDSEAHRSWLLVM